MNKTILSLALVAGLAFTSCKKEATTAEDTKISIEKTLEEAKEESAKELEAAKLEAEEKIKSEVEKAKAKAEAEVKKVKAAANTEINKAKAEVKKIKDKEIKKEILKDMQKNGVILKK